MAKYSFEFKMEVVKTHLNGEDGYGYIAKKFNIPAQKSVQDCIANSKEFEEEGLLRKRQNVKYTLDFKLELIEYYITTGISYKALVLKLGINNPTLITSWISKFRKEGVEGLSKPKGRPPKMKPKQEKEQIIEDTDIDIRIKRRFDTNIVHQKITADTTKFKYYEKGQNGIIQINKVYLDPFMDMYNREIISYRVSSKPSAKNIMGALREAIEVTNDCKYRRTFHSDQGWVSPVDYRELHAVA